MKKLIMAAAIGSAAILGAPRKTLAYDMDCAIILCMAGGFPSSAVCAHAYKTMIHRITPKPVLPPFGVCTFAAAPTSPSAPRQESELNISLPEYAWLHRIRIHWFEGRAFEDRNGDRRWSWSFRSCDRENSGCRNIIFENRSAMPWPNSFVSDNDQIVPFPDPHNSGNFAHRAVMIEFGNYEGDIEHSEWISY
jgi:hypothetical protein